MAGKPTARPMVPAATPNNQLKFSDGLRSIVAERPDDNSRRSCAQEDRAAADKDRAAADKDELPSPKWRPQIRSISSFRRT